MIFLGNHLTDAKTQFKPNQTSNKLQHKNLNSYLKLCIHK